MNSVPRYSPLAIEYEQKYQDRPRHDVIGLLEFPVRSVLEIGCGIGATGKVVKEKFPGVSYCGVEIDPVAAGTARGVLDRVITGNIEQIDLTHYDLRPPVFDAIICGDVLEHLYDPWKVVQNFHRYLKVGGRVVASIPNVQNARILHNLAAGRWTYVDHGLLDATHIRFFTLHDAGELFVRNGYEIEKVVSICDADMPTGGPWPRDIDLGKLILKQVSEQEVNQIFTFQHLIRARSTVSQGGAS